MNKQQLADSVFLSLETVLYFIDREAYQLVWDITNKYNISDVRYQTIHWCGESVEEAVDKFPSRWKNKKVLRQLL